VIGQARVGHNLAHRRAAQHHHLGQHASGVAVQINLGPPRQVRMLVQQRFLRQPVQPPPVAHRCQNRHPCRGPGRGIGTLGGLGRRQRPAPRPQLQPECNVVAPRQPARCVQENHLGHRSVNARKHYPCRPCLMQINQPHHAAPLAKRGITPAAAALLWWIAGVQHPHILASRRLAAIGSSAGLAIIFRHDAARANIWAMRSLFRRQPKNLRLFAALAPPQTGQTCPPPCSPRRARRNRFFL